MPTLKVNLGSLELDSPIIISSGDVARHEVGIRKCDQFRPGAIVLKTTLIEKEFSQVLKPCQSGQYPEAHARYLWHDGAMIGYGSPSHMPIEGWADWLKAHKKEIRTPLIGNVIGISVEGFVQGAMMLQEAGADAIELNYGCPSPLFRRFPYTGPFDKNILREILQAVRAVISIPLGVKTGSFPWSPRLAEEIGLDYICINSIDRGQPPIDIEKIKPRTPAAYGVCGSSSAKYRNYLTLTRVADLIRNIHISTCGGVQKWQDIIEYIMYGASSVQAQTLFVRKGAKIIPEFKQAMLDYMERHGFNTIDEMKGIIIPQIMSTDQIINVYDQTKGVVIAEVDNSKCNGCGVCEDTCYYDAISVKDGMAMVDDELCQGCGACVMNCPVEAVSLRNLDLLIELGRQWAEQYAPHFVELGTVAYDPRDVKKYWQKQ